MEYPKITAPFKRHTEGDRRNKLDIDNWARPEFELLKDLIWEWTEKVDGTNVRVIWDGHKVRFGGRTDNASMPISLVDALNKLFSEELMEDQFGAKPVILYGEGYGARINKGGGNYRPDQSFVLFDALIDGYWLQRENLAAISDGLGVEIVPIFGRATVPEAIECVTYGVRSNWGMGQEAEGLVGRAPLGIMGRDGSRLLMKIKTKDFRTD